MNHTQPPPQPNPAHRWRWPLVAALFALLLYLPLRSISLDDFDSYSFVLALGNYNLALQQPHPPGFPVYVVLGRLFAALLGDPRLALTTLSAVGGAAAAGGIAWLAADDDTPPHQAALAGVLFAAQPVMWLTSLKALSDAPGLALALAAVALLWAGRQDARWLAAGAAVLGLSMGLRPQANIGGVLLAGWLAWEYARAGRWRALGAAALAGLGATLLWLVPVARNAGGLADYLALVRGHSSHLWQNDSLFGAAGSAGTALRARLLDLAQTALLPTLGVDVYRPITAAGALKIAALALFFLGGIALARWHKLRTRLLGVWLLAALLPIVLLESLNRPRLMLPTLPPLVLLAFAGWARWRAGRWLTALAALLLLVAGIGPAIILATEPAPPAQAADYIRETLPPGRTLVAAAGSYRAAQVELPGYPLLYRYTWNEEAARAATNGQYDAIVVLDRESFGGEIDTLSGEGAFVPLAERSFTRDARAHSQHTEVRVQVLVPRRAIGPDDLRLPGDGVLDIGAEDDARYLGMGWFRSEAVGGAQARWAGDGTTSVVRLTPPDGAEDGATLAVRAAAYPPDQSVTLRVNGVELETHALTPDWAEYTWRIPRGVLGTREIAEIELVHARAVSAYDLTSGASPDPRPLAAAYDWVRVSIRAL